MGGSAAPPGVGIRRVLCHHDGMPQQYVAAHYGDHRRYLVKALREIVLETERFFQDVVEPGKGHAVDMEVARQNGEWKIVQARVILMDK